MLLYTVLQKYLPSRLHGVTKKFCFHFRPIGIRVVFCPLKRELWPHKSSVFVVVIMKSKAKMSFRGGNVFLFLLGSACYTET